MAAVTAPLPVSREQVVAAARVYTGVPFRHQGRSREGLDCAGLVIKVMRDLGLAPADYDVTGYGRRPDGQSMAAECRQRLVPVSLAKAAPGDVLLFRVTADPQHLAIVGEIQGARTLIHAYAPSRRVVEIHLAPWWADRMVGAFRLPGVL